MKTTLLILIAAAVTATGAHAQQEDPQRTREQQRERRQRFMPPILLAIDADQDGVISAAEIEGATAALKALDKDGDGQLSAEEWRRPAGARDPAAAAAEFVKRTMESDTDGDGKISQEEAPERMRRAFDRLDTDGDGFVDKAEVEAIAQRFRGGHGGRDRAHRENADRPPRRERPE